MRSPFQARYAPIDAPGVVVTRCARLSIGSSNSSTGAAIKYTSRLASRSSNHVMAPRPSSPNARSGYFERTPSSAVNRTSEATPSANVAANSSSTRVSARASNTTHASPDGATAALRFHVVSPAAPRRTGAPRGCPPPLHQPPQTDSRLSSSASIHAQNNVSPTLRTIGLRLRPVPTASGELQTGVPSRFHTPSCARMAPSCSFSYQATANASARGAISASKDCAAVVVMRSSGSVARPPPSSLRTYTSALPSRVSYHATASPSLQAAMLTSNAPKPLSLIWRGGEQPAAASTQLNQNAPTARAVARRTQSGVTGSTHPQRSKAQSHTPID